MRTWLIAHSVCEKHIVCFTYLRQVLPFRKTVQYRPKFIIQIENSHPLIPNVLPKVWNTNVILVIRKQPRLTFWRWTYALHLIKIYLSKGLINKAIPDSLRLSIRRSHYTQSQTVGRRNGGRGDVFYLPLTQRIPITLIIELSYV